MTSKKGEKRNNRQNQQPTVLQPRTLLICPCQKSLFQCRKRGLISSPGNPLVESNSRCVSLLFSNVALPPCKNRRCSPISISIKTQLTLAAHSSPFLHSSGSLTPYRVDRVSFNLSIENNRQINTTRRSSQTISSRQSRRYDPKHDLSWTHQFL